MKNLFRIIISSLIIFTTPAFAYQYLGNITSCDIVNIGPSKWKASFRFVVSACSTCADSSENWFSMALPTRNAAGKPIANAFAAVAGWENLVLSSTYTTSIISPNLISIKGRNDSAVIGTSTNVSVEFSTAANNGYPALLVRHYNSLVTGSGTVTIVWVTPGSCVLGGQPPMLPPIDELETPEPAFTLKSAVWQLESADVADVPDVSAAGNGHIATIKNIANNNLCMSYVTNGIKKNTYALAVTNSSSTQSGRNLFTMQGGSSSLFYHLQLTSNDGVTGSNYDFPSATTKYINLSQAASSVDKRSEMCWTPKISLFRNGSTSVGMHSDTLSFVVIPKA
ncbi:hypothetical protein [Chania multitudinisentens]|nr:hypothetical protein [Chania multitudinisentens]